MATKKQMKVGRKVSWTARGRGAGLTKEGKVVEIIPAGSVPSTVRTSAKRSRNTDSYVVDVEGKLYWPEPSRLTIVD